jgi:transcriptional regulator with XRE-family HTH domain
MVSDRFLSPRLACTASSSLIRSFGYRVETTRLSALAFVSTWAVPFMACFLGLSTGFGWPHLLAVYRKCIRRGAPCQHLYSVDRMDETMGDRIARLRKKAGMLQEELAGKLDVRQATVSGWERGGGIELENLLALARTLGTSVDYLVTGVHPGSSMEAERKLAAIRAVLDSEPTASGAGGRDLLDDRDARQIKDARAGKPRYDTQGRGSDPAEPSRPKRRAGE